MASSSEAPILLYTQGTANGQSIAIALEELTAAYESFSYDWQSVDLYKNEQKEPWFLKLNPNGRIPVIVDRSRNNFAVFETSAILLYVAQHFDKNHNLWFSPENEPENYSTMLQWLFFAHGGVGPMIGQLNHFNFLAPKRLGIADDLTYSVKRYQDETKRLFGVLEIRLKDRDYLAGSGRGKYSLADIKIVPWLNRKFLPYGGIEGLDQWPAVKAWAERCEEKPAFQAGLKVSPMELPKESTQA